MSKIECLECQELYDEESVLRKALWNKGKFECKCGNVLVDDVTRKIVDRIKEVER